MLQQLAEWNAIHGEAIYGTRPWLVYGESAVKVKGGSFEEDFKYNAQRNPLHHQGRRRSMPSPWAGPTTASSIVRSLAKPAGENVNNITGVSLLGYDGKLDWKQTADGLVVTLPEKKVSEYTAALKIIGSGLKPVAFAAASPVIQPNNRGVLTLDPDSADLHGSLKVEQRQGRANIGYWDDAKDWASWKVEFTKAGTYRVTAQCALPEGKSQIAMKVANATMFATITSTGDWDYYKANDCGFIEISKPGVQEIKVRPGSADAWKAINLREVKIAPEKVTIKKS